MMAFVPRCSLFCFGEPGLGKPRPLTYGAATVVRKNWVSTNLVDFFGRTRSVVIIVFAVQPTP